MREPATARLEATSPDVYEAVELLRSLPTRELPPSAWSAIPPIISALSLALARGDAHAFGTAVGDLEIMTSPSGQRVTRRPVHAPEAVADAASALAATLREWERGNPEAPRVSSNAIVTAPELRTGSAGLNVTEIDRSVAFYRKALGFDVIRRSDEPTRRYALMGLDGNVLLTLWEQSREGFASDRAGLHHLSFETPTLDDLRAVEARLGSMGVTIREHHTGSDAASAGQLFFADPDGIRLEIYTDDLAATRIPQAGPPRCGYFDS